MVEVIFTLNVLRSEFIYLDEEDYIQVKKGTKGILLSSIFMGIPITLISIDDDSGYAYPKDSYEIIKKD